MSSIVRTPTDHHILSNHTRSNPNRVKNSLSSLDDRLDYLRYGIEMNIDTETQMLGAVSSKGASIPMLLLLSMPRMPIQMAWAAQWAALTPYLGLMLPNWAVDLTLLIGPLTGLLVGPTVGELSDRCTHSWGRRRPFLLYGATMSALCYLLMGYTKEMGDWMGDIGDGTNPRTTNRMWTALFVCVFYTWMDVTVNVVQTPVFLIIADFAGDRQVTGAAFGQMWSTIGALAVTGYIYEFGSAHESLKWFLGMLALSMVIVVGLVCIVAHEVRYETDHKLLSTRSRFTSLKQAISAIVDGLITLKRQLSVYCILMFLTQYGYQAYNLHKASFFGVEIFQGDEEGASTCKQFEICSREQQNYNDGVALAQGTPEIVYHFLAIGFALCLPLLVSCIGAKWTLTLSIIPQALLMVMAVSRSKSFAVIVSTLVSITGVSMYGLMVPVILFIMGPNAEIGMYVGAVNSANCFGQLLNIFIGGAMTDTSMGYALPIFVGGVFGLTAVICSYMFLRIQLYTL